MANQKLPEINVLRIISILIVVLLIHIPLSYAYNFYLDLDQYGVFLVNNVGIFVSMGSFAFVSGFGLYLNPNNRNINSTKKLLTFLKKRFIRINTTNKLKPIKVFFLKRISSSSTKSRPLRLKDSLNKLRTKIQVSNPFLKKSVRPECSWPRIGRIAKNVRRPLDSPRAYLKKSQIMPKGKAQADAKAQHTFKYVSILRRFATPPLGIRCIFEIGSS